MKDSEFISSFKESSVSMTDDEIDQIFGIFGAAAGWRIGKSLPHIGLRKTVIDSIRSTRAENALG